MALTNNAQQADTGTKMVHVGKNTRSRIVSKGISAGVSQNAYRGLVQVQPSAKNARNYSQCDSMLIGDTAGANTYPYIQVTYRRKCCEQTHILFSNPHGACCEQVGVARVWAVHQMSYCVRVCFQGLNMVENRHVECATNVKTAGITCFCLC